MTPEKAGVRSGWRSDVTGPVRGWSKTYARCRDRLVWDRETGKLAGCALSASYPLESSGGRTSLRLRLARPESGDGTCSTRLPHGRWWHPFSVQRQRIICEKHGYSIAPAHFRAAKNVRQPSGIGPVTAIALLYDDRIALDEENGELSSRAPGGILPTEITIGVRRRMMGHFLAWRIVQKRYPVGCDICSVRDRAPPMQPARRHAGTESNPLVACFVQLVNHRQKPGGISNRALPGRLQ